VRFNEAKHIREVLSEMVIKDISPVLNLGSSTKNFREKEQPHIDEFIFKPLEEKGVKIYHADMKKSKGVDLVGDIYNKEYQKEIKALSPKLIMCCNIFEHVTDSKGFAEICDELLPSGGFMLVTVPYSYPYHNDPIDTYFRPSPEEIAELFEGYELIHQEIVSDISYREELIMKFPGAKLWVYLLKSFVKFFMPFNNFNAWKKRYHRYFWLFRPFKVSCVLLKKS